MNTAQELLRGHTQPDTPARRPGKAWFTVVVLLAHDFSDVEDSEVYVVPGALPDEDALRQVCRWKSAEDRAELQTELKEDPDNEDLQEQLASFVDWHTGVLLAEYSVCVSKREDEDVIVPGQWVFTTHGTNLMCPDVKAGLVTRCMGHWEVK